MSALQVELVAADRKVWSGEARSIQARTPEGVLGILPGHAPMLGVLVPGEVGIDTSSGRETVHVESGFLSVDHDRVTIVTEQVEGSLSASSTD